MQLKLNNYVVSYIQNISIVFSKNKKDQNPNLQVTDTLQVYLKVNFIVMPALLTGQTPQKSSNFHNNNLPGVRIFANFTVGSCNHWSKGHASSCQQNIDDFFLPLKQDLISEKFYHSRACGTKYQEVRGSWYQILGTRVAID